MLAHTYLNAFVLLEMYTKPIMPFNILNISSNITYKDSKLKSIFSLIWLFRVAVSNTRITFNSSYVNCDLSTKLPPSRNSHI